jgi:hypothetical protein
VPVEIPGAIPFLDDTVHASYDANAVRAFWRSLVAMDDVFNRFRGRFVGKAWRPPRFSGRPAPLHTGQAPNIGPHVMREAYSHEVSSCGYWPGGPGAEGTFYSYAYPEPAGFREAPVAPEGARWDDELAEFVLPYETVRSAADPEETLLAFQQSTYEAAADAGHWDRPRSRGRRGRHQPTRPQPGRQGQVESPASPARCGGTSSQTGPCGRRRSGTCVVGSNPLCSSNTG